MRRSYVDTSAFRSPYSAPTLTLTGVGAWPPGRSYYSIANFLAPYEDFMLNPQSLFGLGAEAVPQEALMRLPPKFRRYVVSGEPIGTFRRDLSAAGAQVPRLVYGLLMVGAGYMGYRSYKHWKKRRRGKKGKG